jgi:hypothetical protein
MSNVEQKYQEELKKCKIQIGNSIKTNTRLLSKDALKYFSLKLEYGIKPINHEEVIEELFSLENVFLIRTPCGDVFDENNEFICEKCAYTKKSLSKDGCLNDIKEKLSLGVTIYFYTYFQYENDEGYYWRYATYKNINK